MTDEPTYINAIKSTVKKGYVIITFKDGHQLEISPVDLATMLYGADHYKFRPSMISITQHNVLYRLKRNPPNESTFKINVRVKK